MSIKKLTNKELAELLVMSAGIDKGWDLLMKEFKSKSDQDQEVILQFVRLNSESVYYRITKSSALKELLIKEINHGLEILL